MNTNLSKIAREVKVMEKQEEYAAIIANQTRPPGLPLAPAVIHLDVATTAMSVAPQTEDVNLDPLVIQELTLPHRPVRRDRRAVDPYQKKTTVKKDKQTKEHNDWVSKTACKPENEKTSEERKLMLVESQKILEKMQKTFNKKKSKMEKVSVPELKERKKLKKNIENPVRTRELLQEPENVNEADNADEPLAGGSGLIKSRGLYRDHLDFGYDFELDNQINSYQELDLANAKVHSKIIFSEHMGSFSNDGLELDGNQETNELNSSGEQVNSCPPDTAQSSTQNVSNVIQANTVSGKVKKAHKKKSVEQDKEPITEFNGSVPDEIRNEQLAQFTDLSESFREGDFLQTKVVQLTVSDLVNSVAIKGQLQRQLNGKKMEELQQYDSDFWDIFDEPKASIAHAFVDCETPRLVLLEANHRISLLKYKHRMQMLTNTDMNRRIKLKVAPLNKESFTQVWDLAIVLYTGHQSACIKLGSLPTYIVKHLTRCFVEEQYRTMGTMSIYDEISLYQGIFESIVEETKKNEMLTTTSKRGDYYDDFLAKKGYVTTKRRIAYDALRVFLMGPVTKLIVLQFYFDKKESLPSGHDFIDHIVAASRRNDLLTADVISKLVPGKYATSLNELHSIRTTGKAISVTNTNGAQVKPTTAILGIEEYYDDFEQVLDGSLLISAKEIPFKDIVRKKLTVMIIDPEVSYRNASVKHGIGENNAGGNIKGSAIGRPGNAYPYLCFGPQIVKPWTGSTKTNLQTQWKSHLTPAVEKKGVKIYAVKGWI